MTDIEALLARAAIGETKARYCRLLDTKQWDQWGQVFTADATMDVSDDVKEIPGAQSCIRGRETIVSQTRALVGPAQHAHQVHSPEIELVSDVEARVIWAMEDWVSFPEDVPAPFKSMHAYGHYHETYVKQDLWRIASLKLTRLCRIITPS